MKTNYSDHAAYWDWDASDDSEAYAFWLEMSRRYGRRVLSPMCALGQTAAFMAKNGCEVLAFDYTEEMVAEGARRFGDVKGLRFAYANVCEFAFDESDFDFCFLASSDIHVLPTLKDVGEALACIGKHVRSGGGLGVEVRLPSRESFSSPERTFHPRVPRSDGPKVWKKSASEYDAETQVQKIRQTVFVEEGGSVRSFEHGVDLHFYVEGELMETFRQHGFEPVGKYSDFRFSASLPEDETIYAELLRK